MAETQANQSVNQAAPSGAEPSGATPQAAPSRSRFGKKVRLTPEEYEVLQQQAKTAADAREQMLRMAADLENARRRMEKERQTHIRLANEEMIRRLLPIADDLERALANAGASGADERVVAGLRMIQRNLDEALRATGLERIATVGEHFDPHRHEAVTQVESSEHPDHTVIEEIRSGFLLNGHVIRAAMVKVAVRLAADSREADSG